MDTRQEDAATEGPAPSDRPSIWEMLVAADETEVDPELLAAYAEGRLSGEEREAVRKLVARSPAAMELLDAITADEPEDASADTDRPDAAAIPQDVSASDISFAQPSPRRVFAPGRSITWRLALAASLLIAVSAAYVAYERGQIVGGLKTQFARLHQELVQGQRQLAQARTESLSLLSGRPAWMDGRASVASVTRAVGDTSVTRSLSDLPPEAQKLRKQEVRELLDRSLKSLPLAETDSLDRLIEVVSLYLAAGERAGALSEIQKGDRFGFDPRLENLRAAANVPSRDEVTGDKAKPELLKAEQILDNLTRKAPDFAPAWFNLALVRERLARLADDDDTAKAQTAAAAAAWKGYEQHESDPALKEAIRRLRGDVFGAKR